MGADAAHQILRICGTLDVYQYELTIKLKLLEVRTAVVNRQYVNQI